MSPEGFISGLWWHFSGVMESSTRGCQEGEGRRRAREKLHFLHYVGDTWRSTRVVLGLTGRWLFQHLVAEMVLLELKVASFPMEVASDLLSVCKESAAEFLRQCYSDGNSRRITANSTSSRPQLQHVPQHPFPSQELALDTGRKKPSGIRSHTHWALGI